jgi:Skp family chaperone for outer membrane proteins
MLSRIRDHVNNIGKILEKLESERDEAAPWQQEAIDRMAPLLKDIAANTTAAIEHLNQNQLRPVSGDYKDYLQQNAETAHALADMISSFVQYDRTRAKLETLQDKIETPTN